MRKLDFQRGSATVEFIGWTAIIVIPLVYFIIYLSYLQATALALESAVQAAGQVAMHAPRNRSRRPTPPPNWPWMIKMCRLMPAKPCTLVALAQVAMMGA